MLPSDGAPLHPGADDARRLLTRELSRPIYHDQQPLLLRLIHWALARISDLLNSAAGGLPPILLVTICLVVVVIVALTLSRLRRSSVRPGEQEAVLAADEPADASTLRARARRCRQAGDLPGALTDFYRAITRCGEERALLLDARGRTALEIARDLGRCFPQETDALIAAAEQFDRVRYGSAPAGEDAVAAMAALDERLTAARPHADPMVDPIGPGGLR